MGARRGQYATRERHMIKDIAYAPPDPASSRGHLLDLYVPADRDGPLPLVIWTGGSAWMAENGREGADAVAADLNPRGFAVAGVAIRSTATTRFPGQLHDIKAAIRWLRANAARHGLDPARIGIMGDSSGGWTAAMAGVTGDIPELEGDIGVPGPAGGGPSSVVQAVVPFYPPTDFLRMDEQMPPGATAEFNRFVGTVDGHDDPRSPESLLLGGPIQAMTEAARQASPITYVRSGQPPFLILHGRRDRLVPYGQSESLYEAISSRGGTVTFVTLPHGEHGAWREFLTEPAIRHDARVRSSCDGRHDEARAMGPTWDTLADFFTAAFSGETTPG
ncbi:MAG: prolyl oligopeptidase family serine peptidase [Actinomadura sp.]